MEIPPRLPPSSVSSSESNLPQNIQNDLANILADLESLQQAQQSGNSNEIFSAETRLTQDTLQLQIDGQSASPALRAAIGQLQSDCTQYNQDINNGASEGQLNADGTRILQDINNIYTM
jgi:hypothetical protein